MAESFKPNDSKNASLFSFQDSIPGVEDQCGKPLFQRLAEPNQITDHPSKGET
jgi:hypothetical protein